MPKNKIDITEFYWVAHVSGITEELAKLHNAEIDILFKTTAKQIFADLEQAAWQQIEPAKLKQFYKEFSEAKDEQAALEIAKKYSVIGFSTEKFDAIKKQYGVE